MTDDETTARFYQVIEEAIAADEEAFERFAEYTEEAMKKLLADGAVPITVTRADDGKIMLHLPADMLHSVILAIHEYMSFDQMVAHQAEIGNAAVILAPMLNGDKIKAIATKTALITLAITKFMEEGN